MKLNYGRTFLVGLGFLSICAFWQIYDSIIPLILKDTFLLGETSTGVIMAADNILALILLPFFGALSDRVNTKIGKRMPFILFGTLIVVFSMLLLPYADMQVNFPLFIIILAVVLVAMGTYRSPAVALMPDITPKPLRSKANSIINLMGALGGVFSLVVMSFLIKKGEDGRTDYTIIFILVAALMVISVAVLFFTIKEKKIALPYEIETNVKKDNQKEEALPKDVMKSLGFLLASVVLWFVAYNAVTTAYSRYVKEVWGMADGSFAQSMLVGTVAAVLSYIPIGFISSVIGRKKMILLGIILMTGAYAFAFSLTEYSVLMYISLILIGIGWAAINVNSYPMVVEMSRSSTTGKYTGIYYTFSMSAQIITPILSGFFIENISYKILFPYAFIFSSLAFCTMLFVKHGDSKPKNKKSVIENYAGEEQ